MNFLVAKNSSGMVTGGYFVEVMDEVARKAGFTWEAYVMNDTSPLDIYVRFTDKVFAIVRKYDIFLGGVAIRPDRRISGMLFGFPLLADDPVLVAYVSVDDPSLLAIMFSFMRPFSVWSWIALLASFLIIAAVYTVIEWSGEDIKEHTPSQALCQGLFLTIGSFTGGAGFGPTTRPGRFLTVTWTFAVLLLTSAYTANLASLLVVKGRTHGEVTDFKDAVRRRIPLCSLPGGAHETALKQRYPDALVSDYHDFRSGGNTLKELDCHGAVIGKSRWEAMKRQPYLNPDCAMDTVGQSLLTMQSSFAGLDENCEGRLMHVLNAHIQRLYEEGALDEMYDRNMHRIAKQDCDISMGSNIEEESALGIKQVGGILGLSLLASLVALAWHAFGGGFSGKVDFEAMSDSDSPRDSSS